jgi:hypothetical protein
VSITDRSHQNREYVRRLLKKKKPEFAAVLERVVWELTRTCDAPSAESPAFEHGPDESLGDRGSAEVPGSDGGEAQRDLAVQVQVRRNPIIQCDPVRSRRVDGLNMGR